MDSRPNLNIVTSIGVIFCLGILAGCGSGGSSKAVTQPPPPPSSAVLSASPTSASFASVAIGQSSSQVVTVTNTGNANATISDVTSSGAGFSVDGVAAGTVIEPNQSASLTVSFSPSVSGS